jgi:hypothetical protein
MQAMVSGVLLVAAFAAAAGACGLMAVRLYRVSGTAAKDRTAAREQDPADG